MGVLHLLLREIESSTELSLHPTISCLCWKSQNHDGLPLGIQMVGKRWDEGHLLAMAKALSEVTGPFQRPPGY
ncbi:MAG: hypothetical protein ACJ797_19435 [Ktedonobacteraceae bacterium]